MSMNRGRGAELSCAAAAVLENLETRVMLASGIGDLKHGALAKLGALGALRQEYLDYIAGHGSGNGFVPPERDLVLSGDGIAIETYANAQYSPKTLLTKLQNRQMRGAMRYVNGVSGVLPFGELTSISQLAELQFARPVWVKTNVGAVTSQGDAGIRSDAARGLYGLTGTGQTVGILSDSFNTSPLWSDRYQQDVASGDLPSNVNIVSDLNSASATDEGRAMAQLVHDGAPGANLSFATADGGQQSFATNIGTLRGDGASVLVDDVSYLNEPMFEDGVIAQAVDAATGAGVPYFSAAANEGSQSYESAFRTGNNRLDGSIAAASGLHFYGGTTHDFDPGPGVDDMQQFTLGPGQNITLSFQWDQPYGSVPGSASCANDMDIYVLNSSGTQVLAEGATDNPGNDPIELVQYVNQTGSTQTLQLMICQFLGAAPGLMKYVDFGSANWSEYATNSSTVFGHANASTAAAVAAAGYSQTPAYGITPAVAESYTSLGGTPILFSTTGARLGSAVVRQEPKFTGVDGGNTTFFTSDDPVDFDSSPNFYGTSAAAPTAAAVAALVRQVNGTLTPAQIVTLLQNSALDMNTPGYDFLTGSGLVRADVALQSIAASSISGQLFVDTNSNALFDGPDTAINGTQVFLDSNNNGTLDAGAIAPASPDVPKSLGDRTTSVSNLTVSGQAGVITDLNVTVSISHNNDADLDVFLISPANQRIELFTDDGGSGHNFTGTTLDDQAGTSITAATAPFSGTFKPEGTLSDVNGINPNGVWKLEVSDDTTNGIGGTLTAWSLSMTTAEQATTTAGSGNYSFSGLVPGNYNLRRSVPAASGFIQTTPTTPALGVTTAAGSALTNKNFGDFPVIYNGTGSGDSYSLSMKSNGTTLQLAQPFAGIIYSVPKTALGSTPLKVSAGGGDDTLSVDYTNGNPIPSGGFFFDGGTGSDSVIITGSNNPDTLTIANALTGPTAGNLDINDPNTGAQTVEAIVFNGNDGNDSLTIASVPSAPLTYNGGLTSTDQDALILDAGSYNFASDLDQATAHLTLGVNNSASVTFGSSQHLAALNVAGGAVTMSANGTRLIRMGTLSINGGTLDMKDNDLIVNSGTLGTINTANSITKYLGDGFNHGSWNGSGLITSMSQALALHGRTSLGALTAGKVLGIGSSSTGVWEGETVTGSTILVKYTYEGDANLSGTVNGDDYMSIDAGFAAHANGWGNGDFDYTNKINADDYYLIDSTYASQGPAL